MTQHPANGRSQPGEEPAHAIIAWLRANANAEKDPKKQAAFIEAHNAALTIKRESSAPTAPAAQGGDIEKLIDCLNDEIDFRQRHGHSHARPQLSVRECELAVQALSRPARVEAVEGDAYDPYNAPDQYFVNMLWKWFEDRGVDLRPERADGLTADDFRVMLDEHEASLISPPSAAVKALADDARHYAQVCPVPDELAGPLRIEMLECRERIARSSAALAATQSTKPGEKDQ